ncbi:MAG: hypothetical protein O9274_11065 [Limnobacter sp.]|uniref:hypothetical protein n=1 Tax=Limnobacter sp. TaxID=2003368 RepID=UPI0022BDC589|nr:hypothetical protein [Limnobacter sp.]MCZ8016229.1 hypothetical protein [Limnobacter sp.]
MLLPIEKPSCYACNSELGKAFQALAFQSHRIEYTRQGNTPSEQAFMEAEAEYIPAYFCSSNCCKSKLGELLAAQGIAEHFKDNRVYGGPICPCGKCGKPVNMTQSHNAWVRGKFFFSALEEDDRTADWFDVLTVVCKACLFVGAKAEVSNELAVPNNPNCAELITEPTGTDVA